MKWFNVVSGAPRPPGLFIALMSLSALLNPSLGRGQTCATNSLGVVSWWRAENNTLDQRGPNNGTLAGNTTFGAGEAGQGFLFDGNGDCVLVGNPASLRLQDFTIEAWISRASSTVVTMAGGDAEFFAYGNGGY